MDKDLVVATLAHIAMFPSNWDQSEWRCRTGMCFAGWATHVKGWTWADPSNPLSDRVRIPAGVKVDDEFDKFKDADGTCVLDAETAASIALSSSLAETEALFGASNTYADLIEEAAMALVMDEDDLVAEVKEYVNTHTLRNLFDEMSRHTDDPVGYLIANS